MKDEKDGLKLLDDLEELNGLPLEKKGTEIKKSLNIDKTLLSRVEGISGPYVLIEGDRDQAIRLAAYIYLEKSTVYSSVYQQKEYEGSPTVISHIKKNKNFLKKAPKGKKIYLELFHYKFKKNEKKQLSYCKYIDQKTGRYSESSFNIEERRGDFVFDDYYKDKEDKPADVKGKPIQKIIYQNHFRYVNQENSYPGKLFQLEIMDPGSSSAMTLFDMLRFKHTVFLLDFMNGIKDEDIDCDKLLDFKNELYELKKNTPGFMIIHVDKINEFPEYFHKLFYVIKLYSIKEEIEIDYVRKLLKYNKKEAEVKPKQIELFELLYKKKDEVVRRSEIQEKLWPSEEVSPIQIEQQVNKLKDALEKLGFKREIIKVHTKTQLSEGAYEFHGNLPLFLE